jgi:hypothetical protein
MYKLTFLLVIMTVMMLSLSYTQTWTSLGSPQVASNVKDITIDKNGTTAYLAESGYVLKSTNGGVGWFVTSNPYATPTVVVVKPNDASRG